MRRQPERVPADLRANPPDPEQMPSASGDARGITPFLVSGGRIDWLLQFEPSLFDPRPLGAQLLCYAYIPRGMIGFLKQIRVAPFMPPVFADPVFNAPHRWRICDNRLLDEPNRPVGQMGVWTTPFGWEAYYDSTLEDRLAPPRWYWHLRLVPGSVDEIRSNRRNVPAFDPSVPASWFLVPEIPVPLSTYSRGLPGSAPGQPWNKQRVQVIQADNLDLHVPIPEHTTICLFTTWNQELINAWERSAAGIIQVSDRQYFPLLPSWGQMLGYSLPVDQVEAIELRRLGWQG
jgi:hypothetical protein